MGHLTRAHLRERLEAVFADVSPATIKRMLYSLFNVYTILNRARADDDVLRFQVHHGTFEAFLFILTAEFPQPGMYRFEELEDGAPCGAGCFGTGSGCTSSSTICGMWVFFPR
jgi:hypothetical protein